MFDKSTYSPELINTEKQWNILQDKFIKLGAEGKQKEHNKWCDKYGYKRLKL